MKKLWVFLLLSILIVLAYLVFTNLPTIIKAIVDIPIAWVISYLAGVGCMYLTQRLSRKHHKKNKPEA